MTDQQPSPEEAEKQEGSLAEEQVVEANAEEAGEHLRILTQQSLLHRRMLR